jgi:hypothetical protein
MSKETLTNYCQHTTQKYLHEMVTDKSLSKSINNKFSLKGVNEEQWSKKHSYTRLQIIFVSISF